MKTKKINVDKPIVLTIDLKGNLLKDVLQEIAIWLDGDETANDRVPSGKCGINCMCMSEHGANCESAIVTFGQGKKD